MRKLILEKNLIKLRTYIFVCVPATKLCTPERLSPKRYYRSKPLFQILSCGPYAQLPRNKFPSVIEDESNTKLAFKTERNLKKPTPCQENSVHLTHIRQLAIAPNEHQFVMSGRCWSVRCKTQIYYYIHCSSFTFYN